jgi:hypothetical protein
MMLIKYGEAISVGSTDVQSTETILSDSDLEIEERMRKFAQELKAIAPAAKDFLYFSCIMMHAAEAALLDETGAFKKDAAGNEITASWEKVGEDGVKWVCSDPNLRPYKNSNNDIFPESELKIAAKKWIGRPLCLDHKSTSVDMIRGVIVDTFYDDKRKRVIALCALDKINYPDLAHKVSSGYATDVSMGTAVGRAICTECQRVARTESDFCEHMKGKSCYGEINLDLNPLEISLVVSGADRGAKIKHIIAKDLSKAADSLSDYMESKISTGKINRDELAAIQKDLQALTEKVAKLVEASEEDNNNNEEVSDTGGTWSGMTRSMPVIQREEPPIQNPPGGIPEPIPSYANDPRASDLQRAIMGAQIKLASLEKDYNKLASMIKDSSEDTMTTKKEAYFQGTIEPKPGQVQYPPEPGEGRARMEDKHMVGRPPFPEVGPVDGSYPNDEEKKKELQRLAAEEEERRMVREAALEKAKAKLAARKQAYFQGTEEPKPGQVQYPPDPGEGQARKEDKQMVGASPFPGVGSVDGLYGDDQKTKEMLARASLKARFRKVSGPDGMIDKAGSRWDIYANDKLILTATVDEITHGNSDNLYDAVATKDFGKSLLGKIKSQGFAETKAALKKQAQGLGGTAAPAPAMPAAPAAPPGAPAPAAPAGAAGAAPGAAPAGDLEPPAEPEIPEVGDEGDQVETISDDLDNLADDMKNKISDLKEALEGVEGEAPQLEEIPAAPEEQFSEAAPQTVASMQGMRKTLNGMLRSGLKEAISDLGAHVKEIQLTRSIYKNKYASMNAQQREYLNTLASDGVRDARETVADSLRLMSAFVKYAHGTASLVKRAQAAQPDVIAPQPAGQAVRPGEVQESAGLPSPESLPNAPAGMYERGLTQPERAGLKLSQPADANDDADVITPSGPKSKLDPETQKMFQGLTELLAPEEGGGLPGRPMFETPPGEESPEMWERGIEEHAPGGTAGLSPFDANDAMEDATPEQKAAMFDIITQNAKQGVDLRTKEGRAMYRTKLAQKGLTFSDMLNKAHPGAGPEPGGFDTKPSGDLAKVELLEETHSKMMDLANLPPKVRKQAEEIHRLVKAGKLDPNDLDKLVAEGVDADAVKYYKQYWAEAKDADSKEFANKLTQEHVKQKKAEELNTEKVRIKRAYQLAFEMQKKGMLENDQVDTQVEKILKWNDEGFESVKNIVAKKSEIEKSASAVPTVGLLHSDQVILPSAQASQQSSDQVELRAVLDQHFANKKF